MKEFFKSPKKTAILGLIGSVIALLPILLVYLVYSIYNTISYIFCNFYFIGFIIYFSIVLLRMNGKGSDIKKANYFLIISIIITIVSNGIFGFLEGESIFTLNDITLLAMILYFNNIFFKKAKFMNNKIFIVIISIISIYLIINNTIGLVTKYNEMIYFMDWSYILFRYIKYLAQIIIIPYFYNYYNLLKEENKNGK